MLKGSHLDLARVLAKEITRSIDTTRAITHPSLVHKLCVYAGVPDVIEQEMKPGEILGDRMLNRKKARLASERDPEQGFEEEEEYRQRASSSTPSYGERVLNTLERMEGRLEGLERRLTRIEKINKFLKKQGAALKRLFGLKKKNKEPSNSKEKNVVEDDEMDYEDDEELGLEIDEEEDELDRIMAEAFDEDAGKDNEGDDDADLGAGPGFDDPFGDDSPVL